MLIILKKGAPFREVASTLATGACVWLKRCKGVPTLAYDGLYTTALKTFKDGPLTMSQAVFEKSYKEITNEWDIHANTINLPSDWKYIVLHIRGSDKGPGGSYKPSLKSEVNGAIWMESDERISSTSPHYCTYEAVDHIHRSHPGLSIFLVSEDQSAKRRIMADFGHILSSLPYPTFENDMAKTKITNELIDMELMMHAAGIIQHSPWSWSAFSSNIAAAKSIPLLNTWKGNDKLFNNEGYIGSIPSEFMICEEPNVIKNIEEFSSRLLI